MQHKIEFKDLNNAGQAAVGGALIESIHIMQTWGFTCGESPFSFADPEACEALQNALVDFLVATNQPTKGVSNG